MRYGEPANFIDAVKELPPAARFDADTLISQVQLQTDLGLAVTGSA